MAAPPRYPVRASTLEMRGAEKPPTRLTCRRAAAQAGKREMKNSCPLLTVSQSTQLGTLQADAISSLQEGPSCASTRSRRLLCPPSS